MYTNINGREETLKVFVCLKERRTVANALQVLKKSTADSLREREMCWRASGHYELALMERGWRLFQKHHEIIGIHDLI